jgi:phosphoribosylaminoimidazolecarboxamide formyltransferase / IMP cyclohydrolase
MTRGIGTGQTSRLRSTTIALTQAGLFARGAVLASDSFFPFDDSVKLAAKHSIGCIVQQGGSINDQRSIEAANKYEIPMVFTGRRAFWH